MIYSGAGVFATSDPGWVHDRGVVAFFLVQDD